MPATGILAASDRVGVESTGIKPTRLKAHPPARQSRPLQSRSEPSAAPVAMPWWA